jgi:crotonobetainyl-CoA:carnitine CoA-transferase CaiB-like acyl-CoA transferase
MVEAELLQRLLPTADIVLESDAPGTLAGWGCGFATLHQQWHKVCAV